LLPECTTSYIIDRNGYINSYNSDKGQVSFKNILVLVDENSASSAELLALGLKKYLNNVTIIGKPTFGKGVGQNIYEDKQKKYMIFLVSFYWNVKEENISGSKIYPDVKINTTSNEEYIRAIKAQIK
jgi:C-terminal processing protease CtpA/Prc